MCFALLSLRPLLHECSGDVQLTGNSFVLELTLALYFERFSRTFHRLNRATLRALELRVLRVD
jgi:hypothetical protein